MFIRCSLGLTKWINMGSGYCTFGSTTFSSENSTLMITKIVPIARRFLAIAAIESKLNSKVCFSSGESTYVQVKQLLANQLLSKPTSSHACTGMETGRFDTKLFRYKSFQYELKQWNFTTVSINSSIVCSFEHLGWIFLVLYAKFVKLFTPQLTVWSTCNKTTCIETTGNHWDAFLHVYVYFCCCCLFVLIATNILCLATIL